MIVHKKIKNKKLLNQILIYVLKKKKLINFKFLQHYKFKILQYNINLYFTLINKYKIQKTRISYFINYFQKIKNLKQKQLKAYSGFIDKIIKFTQYHKPFLNTPNFIKNKFFFFLNYYTKKLKFKFQLKQTKERKKQYLNQYFKLLNLLKLELKYKNKKIFKNFKYSKPFLLLKQTRKSLNIFLYQHNLLKILKKQKKNLQKSYKLKKKTIREFQNPINKSIKGKVYL